MNTDSLSLLDNLCLSDGTSVVITPNQRLSKYLANRYKQNFLVSHSNKRALYKSNIYSLDAWLKVCFESLQKQFPFLYGNYQVLTNEQEKLLWQHIIYNSESSHSLLLPKNCAQDVMQAYALFNQWQLTKSRIETSHYYLSIDQRCFFEWQQQFELHCEKNQQISATKLASFISNAIEKNYILLQDEYYFYGFDEITPAIQLLQEQLIKAGKKITAIALPNQQASYQKQLKCSDFNQEILLAAAWAKKISTTVPNAQIAVVIPSLAENRQTIYNQFIKTLQTQALYSGNTSDSLVFNISSGLPLSDVPLVKSALLCLDVLKLTLFNQKIDRANFSEFIRNPFIFNEILTKQSRLVIDKHIRSSERATFSKKQVLNILHKSTISSEYVNIMAGILNEDINEQTKYSHTQWRNIFLTHLEKCAWLKEKTLDSESFQASKKLFDIINSFAQLDDCLASCNLTQALSHLNDLLRNHLFQAEATNENKNTIHILGVLEAAGQNFTHLWLCEMHNKTWPAKAKPNPFLPIPLQKELNMPHSSAQRELAFCKNMTHRFQHHCDHIIFSYGEFDKDEQLNPSPLIMHIETIERSQLISDFQLNESDSLQEKIFKLQKIEFIDDQENIPVNKTEHITGGQNIIKQQAQCPFSAFAAHRLKITTLDEYQDGISAIERGNIIHLLMEYFWREVKNQAELLKLNEVAISNLLKKLSEKIHQELSKNFNEKKMAFSLELERAQEVALAFLNLEKQRENFEVVFFEDKQKQHFNGLDLSLRIDRIDRLDDGSEVIIDYKTGSAHISSWSNPRIEEPQLPIYLMNNVKAEAIAFAVLNKNNKELGYKGIASKKRQILGLIDCQDEKTNKYFPLSWDVMLADWKNDIEKHANQFMQGVNTVDPKNSHTSCAYCEFSSICRIHEINTLQHNDDFILNE